MRQRLCIDEDWRFCLGDRPNAVDPTFDDSRWRELDLPHDWSIEATPLPDNPAQSGGGFFPGGVGWYRKSIAIPPDLDDRRVLIEFDGAYMNSEVFCNGSFCGRRPYGYSSFCYDITGHVDAGKPAVIAVRIDNSRQRNSRWYTGSGIYRHVWLTYASPIRVDHWGTYVTTPSVSTAGARIECAATIINDMAEDREIRISTRLLSPAETEIGEIRNTLMSRGGGERCESTATLAVPDPDLWSPESPALYTLRTTVQSQNGDILDDYDTRCGIRSIRFDPNLGFFLNENNIKLKGVNEHHDAGCLGAAVPDDVIRRRFRILKDMGCNSIRTAHNPASPAFLDLCDEMGFMVVADAFDEWRDGKTPFGYQLYWDQWWKRDLTDMILRDRNHPSIIMWSVGNEIKEVREGRPDGLKIIAALQRACHEADPTRPMTCGCNAIRITNAAGYGSFMDVVGYNGGGGSCFDYEKDHETYPDRVIFASEVPHTLQTRGIYRTRTWYRDLAENPDIERIDVPHLADEEVFNGVNRHYQSSYDNAMVRISAIDSWRLTSTLPFMCGEFRWSGFDYIGECYGWPAKSWNFGVIDLCGFPKDTYYFYQSQWTDEPMVHILPHWTWPGLEGKTIPVVAYSNCEYVELSLDGVVVGRKMMDRSLFLKWDVPYSPGTLRAVGINGDAPAAECIVQTSGRASALKLSSDERSIRADGTGVTHITALVVDEHGRCVPDAHPEITFHVKGPGTLIGLENGDPIDTTNYKLPQRAAFNGMALAIVQSLKGEGQIAVTAKADGLSSDTVQIEAVHTDGSVR